MTSWAKELTIKITQDHIDRGLRRISDQCPIALAIKDHFGPNCTWSCAGRAWISVGMRTQLGPILYTLTIQLQQFMDDFDAGREVSPGRFRTVVILEKEVSNDIS